jgi:rsbT co-antagonist protein RsbR
MQTISSPTPLTPEPQRSSLQQWRYQALNIILYVAFGVGLLSVLPSIFSVLAIGQVNLALFYATFLAILAVAAFVHALPYRLRAGILLAIPFVFGMVELFEFGYTRDGNLLLFSSVVLAALLLDKLWIALLLGASMVVLSLVSWLSATDQLAFVRAPELSFVLPLPLISSLAIYLVLSLMIVVALTSLINRLSQSLQNAEQATHQAIAARQEAEQQANLLAEQSAALSNTEQQLRDLVATLETPSINLADGVLLAPIVGTVDSQRAEVLASRLLQEVQRQRVHLVILDIAGIALVDTGVAQALVHTTQALRLLGCQVAITGISAGIAITFTHLGIDLHDIRTARSPQDVLAIDHDRAVVV